MKTIGIDFSPAQISPAGIGQYTLNLTKELITSDKSNSYILYSNQPITEFGLPPNCRNIVFPIKSNLPGKGFRYMNEVKRSLIKEKADILISYSNHSFALLFNRTILFIHDLAPIKYAKFFSKSARFFYPITTKLACKRALKILTVSETIKNEIIEYTGIKAPKIDVIYPSINKELLKSSSAKLSMKLPNKFILSISTLEPRKNYLTAIKAFNQSLKSYPDLKYLIIGKKGWYYEKIFKTVEELGLKGKVKFLGYQDDATTAKILSKASALLYLSEYEGFGMPPMEAIFFNVPAIVSDIPVFREVYEETASFVDIKNIDEVAKKLISILKNPKQIDKNTRGALLKKYSWENSANKLLKIIKGE